MPEKLSHGQRLKKFRLTAGLTQRELAAKINVTHSNVNYWENCDKLPNSNALVPMAKAFNVSLEELLGQPVAPKNKIPGGKLGEVFASASQLPRRKQQKIADVVEALIVQDAI